MSVESYFAQRMRDLRNLHGMSQVELEAKVAESDGPLGDPKGLSILRMEKGRRRVRLDEAVAIAEALGVPLAEMLPAGATGEQRQIVQLPPSLVERLRTLHEVTGAVIRLADPEVTS